MGQQWHRTTLDASLQLVLDALVNDRPLGSRYHDHRLLGEWNDHRDCHVKPDLVLIYRKLGDEALLLVRLGSHAKLDLK
jgi:mRNA interferase YafQ